MQSFYNENPESPELYREFFAQGPWFHRAVFSLWRCADSRGMNSLGAVFGPQYSTYIMVAPWTGLHASIEWVPKFYSKEYAANNPQKMRGCPVERLVRVTKQVMDPETSQIEIVAHCLLNEGEIFPLDRQR